MAKRGRPRKMTPQELKAACDRYFDTITRVRTATELIDSGRRDDKGHVILMPVEVRNRRGETVEVIDYIVPPDIRDMCLNHLHIHHSTWAAYAKDERYREVVEEVRDRIIAWAVRELNTRPGKDVRGIEANLRLNYGLTERREIELGERAAKSVSAAALTMDEREEILREIAEEWRQDDSG